MREIAFEATLLGAVALYEGLCSAGERMGIRFSARKLLLNESFCNK